MMRVIIAISFLFLSQTLISQSITDPFIGGVEIGIGLSSVARLDYGLENIEFLPFQIGLVTNKYLSNKNFIEIGLLYGRRTVRLRRLKDVVNLENPILSLNYIDIPLKYYFDRINIFNSYYDAYCGLIFSYLIYPSTYSTGTYPPEITNSSYRNLNLSLCTGLSKKINTNRIKLQLATAITSVYKIGAVSNNPYYEQNEIGRVFPMTLIVSYGYIFSY